MNRRLFLGLVAAALGLPAGAGARESSLPFSAAGLRDHARALSARPYSPRPLVPQAWQDMSYDDYRMFWFRVDRALWEGTEAPARVDFFLPGLYFPRPVTVHVVEDGMARELAFDPALFDRTDRAPDLPVDDTLGYSGLRLRGELETPNIYQEFAVFQGASYFRAHGQGQIHGISARGLALDTAEPAGEEFPDFTAFWLETPAPGARSLIVHALLDSPSTTGAYRFVLHPGKDTVMEVEAVLFPRRALGHAGLAPLTSMFLFDGTNRHRFDDFRPQVHDSNGLLIHNGAGELLWRPLAKQRNLQISSFVDDGPRGFGLMQRSRALADFADLEALYHLRPSLWVEPGEGWGRGAVTLVEIPADLEIYDNIVAYWRPREGLPSGQPHELTYRLHWGTGTPPLRNVAPVLRTLIGRDAFAEGNVVAVEFGPHAALEDLEALTVHASGNAGVLSPGRVQRNPETGGARLSFSFQPGGAPSIELRAQLLAGTRPVSEVWLYRWTA